MFIDIIAGTRPNLVKVAPIINALNKRNDRILNYRFIYTGQHYDNTLSTYFFHDLGLPSPDINLEVGSGSHAVQTANIMTGYESVLDQKKPDLCLVVGDVNSTLACAITAKKCIVEVAHVEAGIRSGDTRMPEEINRIVTDSISDWFYTTGIHANRNLIGVGVPKEQIITIGNTMIDTLCAKFDALVKPSIWDTIGLTENDYLMLTLHRPDNVDNPGKLEELLIAIDNGVKKHKVLFPVHPRTQRILDAIDMRLSNIITVEPIRYLEFLYLVSLCRGVITDSGGLSEETTFLNKPCITLRNTTERPETIELGTNVLTENCPDKLKEYLRSLCSARWKQGEVPPLWDGKAALRIVDHLVALSGEGEKLDGTI